MDGLTLAAQVNAEYPDAYKIMITGYGEFEYAQAALKSNVRDYLLKPVDDDKLCEALERAREWHGQRPAGTPGAGKPQERRRADAPGCSPIIRCAPGLPSLWVRQGRLM